MRKVLLSLAASMAIATPALANEGRFEGRGGVIWDQGQEEAIAGVAAGYDFDLGTSAFAGPEVSADKILTDGTKVSFGIGARAGFKTSEVGKLYAIGGWQSETCDACEDSWSLGAGYQHAFGTGLYGKVEYRHFFYDNGFSDPDAVAVGLGLRF